MLDGFPRWDDLSCLSIRYLRTAEDASATEADVKDPAHWAVYLTEDYAYFDRETGEPVDDAHAFDDRHSSTTRRSNPKKGCATTTRSRNARCSFRSGTAWTTRVQA